jgi:hypothetical protein
MRALILVLVSVGCGAGLATVSEHDMQVVPKAEQAKIDHDQSAELTRIQTEQRTASKAIGDARSALAAHRGHAQPVVATAAPGDDWAEAMRAHDHARTVALAEIDAATVAWLHARIAVHEQELEHATSELAVLHCRRELSRAYAVDRHLLGDDTYDTAPFRGQLASVQTRWYAAELRGSDARAALQRASTQLATAKDRYAQLVRSGPNAPSSSEQVASWSPSQERDRNHHLHLVHAAAIERTAHYLVPPPRH